MRRAAAALWLGLWGLAGCAHHPAVAPAENSPPAPLFSELPAPPAANQRLLVVPGNDVSGKVVRVNTIARFVVLTFPVGHIPALEQRLGLFRLGSKTGEVKVTGPQLDDSIVADLVEGEAEVGDEVRTR